jgi:phospholipid/cholesterol/gamma-HCH transport system ATP-binding protein
MAGDDIVIRIRGLRSAFGEQVVHEDLDLDVYRGEIIGVVGGSGTGKSVLLKAIVGLGKPTAGHIEVFGQSVLDATEKQLKTLERRWGVLFQDGALFSSLTVAENIAVPIKEYLKVPHDLMCEIIALKLSLVGLPPDTGVKYPSQLSGGMRKRASLARALALDPELLFLDEPTSGLDPIGANAFDELIKNLQQTLGLTVFMVTHDLDSLASVCDRIAVLADRRVLAVGTMADMLRQTHPWIRDYFHGPRARAADIQSDVSVQ